MTFMKTGTLALALAAIAALTTPSLAQQMTRAERMSMERETRVEAQYDRSSYRASQLPEGYGINAYGQNWNECRIDNGYGRFDTCHH